MLLFRMFYFYFIYNGVKGRDYVRYLKVKLSNVIFYLILI